MVKIPDRDLHFDEDSEDLLAVSFEEDREAGEPFSDGKLVILRNHVF